MALRVLVTQPRPHPGHTCSLPCSQRGCRAGRLLSNYQLNEWVDEWMNERMNKLPLSIY